MQAGGIVDEELPADNAIRKMVQSGSKGNFNICQVRAQPLAPPPCRRVPSPTPAPASPTSQVHVGQQSIEGHRVFPEKGERALPSLRSTTARWPGTGLCRTRTGSGCCRRVFLPLDGRPGGSR